MKPTAQEPNSCDKPSNNNDLREANGSEDIARAALPADLEVVIRSWPDLPEPVKAGIVAMVKSASRTESQGIAGGE